MDSMQVKSKYDRHRQKFLYSDKKKGLLIEDLFL